MLSSPDGRLAARQPNLPGLALVLDPAALAAAARSKGLLLPEGCTPSYVRFKPGTRCLVGHTPAGVHGPPLFYASALERNSAKLVKAMKRRVVHSEKGPGRVVLEDAVEVCVFPNDDHLSVLICLADPDRRGKLLRRLLPDGPWAGDTKAQTLAYKPERRCVIKCTAPDGSAAVLKAYEKNGFDAALARARHFCSVPSEQGMQQLLGMDERHRLIAMTWLPGRSLGDELRQPSLASSHVMGAGALLADLHESALIGLPAWSVAAADCRLREIVSVLGAICPEMSERADGLARRVSAALSVEAASTVVLHGDFDARQVLIEGESVALIDFDEATVGPAPVDIGNFISHLHMNALRREISDTMATAAAEMLLAGYAEKRPAPSPRSVRTFTALALINVVHEPFRRHRPEWPTEIAAVLDRIERLLETPN